jgi:hypothetical protein
MKLRNFLVVVVVGVGLGVFGLVKLLGSRDADPRAPAPPEVAVTAPVTATTPTATPTPTPTPTPTMSATTMSARGHDPETLGWANKPLSGDKGKDVSKGKPYKINVYKDAGQAGVNRAKVDLDRDDKFDEKYTFVANTVTLQVAPDDDENYTATYTWTGDAWRPEAGTTAVAPRAEAPELPKPGAPELPARAYDAEVIAWKDRTIQGDKVKDAIRGHTYKVNVYKDAGASTVNRAKVDLDRDDKWDEKFTFEKSGITLQRAPADDDQYTETYHWSGTGWIRDLANASRGAR